MDKKRSIIRFLLLVVSVSSSFISTSMNCQPVIELLNNSESTIFVGNQPVKPHKTFDIPLGRNHPRLPLFSIKENGSKGPSRQYHIYCKNDQRKSFFDDSSLKMDFRTIRFIARAEKKQSGYDEVSVHNDTPYDITLSFTQNMSSTPGHKEHAKAGIIVEPGNTFHKTVSYVNSKDGKKNLKTLSLLLFSIMSAQNKGVYSVRFPSRVYSHESLVGLAGWKTKTIMASTIKLFNEHFTVECI